MGGHLIKQHVGKTAIQLTQRIGQESITNASSFYDLASAEMAVSQAIEANQAKIMVYLQQKNTHYLSIHYLVVKNQPGAINVSGVRVE